MRPLSEATARVSGNCFKRKYITLGRIVEHWDDILGTKLSSKAQPVKIFYRKHKKKDIKEATLTIAACTSHATLLHYQKDLILEKINRIFGDKWITDIKFIDAPMPKTIIPARTTKPLTPESEKYIASYLENITDHDIRERLMSLGHHLMKE